MQNDGPSAQGGRVLRLIGRIFLTLSLLLLGISAWLTQSEWRFLAAMPEVEARVVANRPNPGNRTFVPVFRYRTPDGQEVEVSGTVGTRPPAYAVGQRVMLHYDPAHPQRISTGGWTGYFFAIATGIVGGVFLLIAIGMLVQAALRLRRVRAGI